MSQNRISLNWTEADYTEIDTMLAALETKLAPLVDLRLDERKSLIKMGHKSEAFCRQTLTVLAQNRHLVPTSLDVDDAQRDLVDLDALRPLTTRLRQLLGKAEDSQMALGSDVMSAALDGYAMLKVVGKGSGLEALRQGMARRFNRSPRVPSVAVEA